MPHELLGLDPGAALLKPGLAFHADEFATNQSAALAAAKCCISPSQTDCPNSEDGPLSVIFLHDNALQVDFGRSLEAFHSL